jgi:hypothetical protein
MRESELLLSSLGPVTAVQSCHATADQKARVLAWFEVKTIVEELRRDDSRHTLVALATLAGGIEPCMPSHISSLKLLELVGAALESGRLLLVPGRSFGGRPTGSREGGQTAAASDEAARGRSRSPDALVSAIMAGQETLVFQGNLYRFSRAGNVDTSPESTQFQVVRLEEARGLVSGMQASPGTAASKRQALATVADLLVDRSAPGGAPGIMLLRRSPQVQRRFQTTDVEPAVTPSQLRQRAPKKADIEVKFIESGSGRPLANVAFLVRSPDGSESQLLTSSAGAVKLTGLDPGHCAVTSLIDDATAATSYAVASGGTADPSAKRDSRPLGPAAVVATATHRLKTGDTPESIADQAGVPWETIAKFNWETSEPARLQEFFRSRLGCTKKTPDGKTYVFDDKDDPGIILIPRPWEGSFAVGEFHTVYVTSLRTVYISLENEAGLAIPGAAYEVTFADGSQRQGRLGRSGIARLTGVPDAAFSVAYPGQNDLLARSLATSIRRAFEEHATGPLFYLLGQTQEIIDQAVSVYAEYFNDLTSKGLAADIDQIVTDPDARPPLTFLCSLAGLGIEGAAQAKVQRGSSEGETAGNG